MRGPDKRDDGERRGSPRVTPPHAGSTDAVDRDRHADISAVVFDLGGVLIDWDPRYVLTDEQVTALDIDAAQAELDRGASVEQVRARWLETHPADAMLVNRYFDRWHHTLAGDITEVVDILTELTERPMRLYALSNFSGELFRQNRHRFAFLGLFDGVVISGDEGVIKPEETIYRVLIERYDLEPSATVFIDDREDNVAGAAAAGLVGLHFTSAVALRRDLEALAVL